MVENSATLHGQELVGSHHATDSRAGDTKAQVTSGTTRQANMQQRAALLALNQFVEYCAGAEEEKWYKYVCRIVEKTYYRRPPGGPS